MSRLRHMKAGAYSGIGRLQKNKVKSFIRPDPSHDGENHSEKHSDDGKRYGTKLEATRMDGWAPSENRLGRKRGGKAGGGWIKSAIKHPGAEKKAAEKAGMSTHAYMEKHADDSGKAGSRARLGLRLSAMAKHKG
jgi:hypothetical protein